MKKTVIFRLIPLFLGFLLLMSCSSSSSVPMGARRSSVPPQCEFKPYKKSTKKHSPRQTPSNTTPIGGNYRIRY